MSDKRGGYAIEDYEPFFSGRATVPNFVEIAPSDFLNVLAASSGLEITGAKVARLPDSTGSYVPWARYFLICTQGGRLDGTGYVVVYNSAYRDGNSFGGRAGRFAICQHEKVPDPGAAPARGWHPGRCKLCGLDMTVDSGD